jgi:hypothetical protein
MLIYVARTVALAHCLDMTTADFGRIETCSCCGKNVKRPVTYRGKLVGKDCRDAILCVRSRLSSAKCYPAEQHGDTPSSAQVWDREMAIIKRDWPRVWEKLVAWAEVA